MSARWTPAATSPNAGTVVVRPPPRVAGSSISRGGRILVNACCRMSLSTIGTVPKVNYSGRMAQVYDAGRRLPPATMDIWIGAASRYLPSHGKPILDLGSGTGRFSETLAQTVGSVVALEPAAGMRARAVAGRHPELALVGGRGEALPFGDDAFGGIWASQVLHHVDDLTTCAHELRRVLIPGAPLLVRSMFDLEHQWPLAPYFPGALRIDKEQFPSLDELRQHLGAAGLHEQVHEQIEQLVAQGPREFYERTATRADSGLELLSDREFNDGLKRLRRDIDAGVFTTPIEILDLIVFR
jgi:ubiquinone/menaquinone biosynthesis C-methylase UbiE